MTPRSRRPLRADQLQEDGDWQETLTWHRILDAIKRLQAKRRRKATQRTVLVVPWRQYSDNRHLRIVTSLTRLQSRQA